MCTGYQEEDIDISNPGSFLCVLENYVLDQDGVPVQDHHYVFSPEVVQKKVSLLPYSYLIFMFLYQVDTKSNIAKRVEVPIELLHPNTVRDQFARVISVPPCGA